MTNMSMNNKRNYTLVWKECDEKSAYSKRFYVPGYIGYLPFFIYGEDLERLEKGDNVELREENLLKGILYGLYEYEHDKKPWHSDNSKQTLLHLLDVLGNGFGFQSPENMILDVAYDVRSKNGNDPSCIILQVGLQLIPNSAKIMSDLICDTWSVLASGSSKESQNEGLQKIVSLIYGIKMDDVLPSARESISYIGLSALILLSRQDAVPEYLDTFIYPHVKNRKLKDKIKFMLENPSNIVIESMQLKRNNQP